MTLIKGSRISGGPDIVPYKYIYLVGLSISHCERLEKNVNKIKHFKEEEEELRMLL